MQDNLKTLDDVKELYLVTCYFTRLKDPQHGIVRNIPDIKYIKPWYESVNRLKINGVIFHDNLLHGGCLNESGLTRVSIEFTIFTKKTN